MTRRASDVGMLTVSCSADEMACIDDMKISAGVASDADLVRVALWNLADHLQIDPANGVFDLRPRLGPGKKAAVKAATA